MSILPGNIDALHQLAKDNHDAYKNADPFPSGYFDNFFNEQFLNEVLEEFPDMSAKPDLKFNDPNQIKLASKGEYRFGPKTKELMHFLNSQPFLEFLSILTGIQNLVPDPFFEGGGCHQIQPGGLLKVHADFNKHPNNHLDRRINVLVYLNKDWDESYGGHFELWDLEMKEARKKILPVFNRMAMFSTTSTSWHGHPNPLTCPPGKNRKSLALYYYSNGRPEEGGVSAGDAHNTLFRKRPEDNKANWSFRNVIKMVTPPILVEVVKKLKGSA